MTQIAIHFDTPVVSVGRFCERSGMTKTTVHNVIAAGRVNRKPPSNGKWSKTFPSRQPHPIPPGDPQWPFSCIPAPYKPPTTSTHVNRPRTRSPDGNRAPPRPP
ncbi:hypothetical protein B6S09_06700 [Oceanimonas baumannii]|uniref:Uncharacterized protein n=1 Tax=Oceanimonas baumannii TaxID=129578 RepID=A0A235CJZ0_9GAMM|nr:hypothetical protein B6S09_06700 [Oceanimonas baumannii]